MHEKFREGRDFLTPPFHSKVRPVDRVIRGEFQSLREELLSSDEEKCRDERSEEYKKRCKEYLLSLTAYLTSIDLRQLQEFESIKSNEEPFDLYISIGTNNIPLLKLSKTDIEIFTLLAANYILKVLKSFDKGNKEIREKHHECHDLISHHVRIMFKQLKYILKLIIENNKTFTGSLSSLFYAGRVLEAILRLNSTLEGISDYDRRVSVILDNKIFLSESFYENFLSKKKQNNVIKDIFHSRNTY